MEELEKEGKGKIVYSRNRNGLAVKAKYELVTIHTT